MGKSKEKTFDEHKITYESNDVFYLFSDGYRDQIGEVSRKRFLRDNFASLLTKVHQLPFNHQLENLKETLAAWKGDNHQTDDIVVMGFKP